MVFICMFMGMWTPHIGGTERKLEIVVFACIILLYSVTCHVYSLLSIAKHAVMCSYAMSCSKYL